MALVLANRVQETTTTTGTGTITLAGAVAGFQSFAVVGNGNTTYYTITSGSAWEVGIGTYSTAGPTLARTTILSSSAGGAAITLAGTSAVFVTYPAEDSVYQDGATIAAGTAVLGVTNGGTGVTTSTGTGSVVLSASPTFTNTVSAANITATGTVNVSGGALNSSGAATVGLIATGTIIIGATTSANAITLGRSTVSQTTSIQAGATTSGNTKTINLGTGGLAGSTTTITIGSTAGTSTTTLNGDVSFAGTIAAPLGSAAAPSYTFTGDTNTGIFSPGADTIAFSEGGVEAMRIDSSGNVGIGTSAPGKKLTVAASTDQLSLTTGTNELIARASSSEAALYTFQAIPLNFYTNNAERMRITSAGNVGIGTTTPLARLFAETPVSVGAAFAYAANSNGAYPTGVFGGSFGYNFSAGGAEVDFWNGWTGATGTQGGFAFRRQTGASSQNLLMTIRGDGNVGIGTSSPSYQATVLGLGQETAALTDAGNKGGSLYLQATGITAGSGGAVLFGTTFGNQTPFAAIKGLVTDGTNNTIGDLAFSTRNATSDTALTERMRILRAGNVGIGTTAPAQKLDIRGGDLQVSRGAAGVAADAAINFGSNANNYIFSGNTNNIMAFATNGSERMRITSAGNVGIGTSAPGVGKLRVVQGASEVAFLSEGANSPGYPQFGFSGQTADNGGRGAGMYLPGDSTLAFSTLATERMRITSAGNVGIGETAPGARLHVSGGTVGTTAGNLLNVTIDQGIAGSNAVGIRTNLVRVSSGTDWTTTAMRLQGRVDATNFGYIDLVTGGAQGMTFGSDASERMRIDATGNLLVGTTSATGRLTVQSAGSDVGYFDTTDTTGGPKVLAIRSIASSGTSTPALVIRQWRTSFAGSQNAGEIRFDGLTTTGNYAEFASIYATSGANSASGAPTAITFQTMNASYVTGERMRIDSAGNLLVGSASSPSGSGTNLQVSNAGSARMWLTSTGNRNFYLESGSAAALQFVDGTAAAERMRIDSAGNVGIGTSSPGYRLDIASGDTSAGLGYAMRLRSNATATAATIQFTNSAVSTQNGLIACTDTGGMTIQTDGASSVLAFRTNGNERARVNSSGELLVGTTTGGRTVCISSADNWIRMSNASRSYLIGNSNSSAFNIFDETGGATRFQIAADGTANVFGLLVGRSSASTDVNTANDTGSFSVRGSSTTIASMSFHRTGAFAINMGLGTDNVFRIGGWSASSNAFQMDSGGNLTMLGNVTAYSDARIKKDVETIDSALDLVSKMRGVRYTRIDNDKRGVGVIAQEMLEVCPEVVQQGVGDDDTLSVAYGNLVGVLIEAVKELTARVAELEGK